MVAPRWQTFSTIPRGPGITEPCTCEQARCQKRANGWQVVLDLDIPLARHRADYIRHITARAHSESWQSETVVVFTFDPGVPCFSDVRDVRGRRAFDAPVHTRRVRTGLHVVTNGRTEQIVPQITATGQPRQADIARVHTRPEDWCEHAFESLDHLTKVRNKLLA